MYRSLSESSPHAARDDGPIWSVSAPPEPAVQVPLSVLQSASAENVPSAANAIVYFG